MNEPDPVWVSEDRDFINARFQEIAERLVKKGFIPSHRKKEWRIILPDGQVFKFTVTGYLKSKSKADLEYKAEMQKLMDEAWVSPADIIV